MVEVMRYKTESPHEAPREVPREVLIVRLYSDFDISQPIDR
jgi:hypothetical protein